MRNLDLGPGSERTSPRRLPAWAGLVLFGYALAAGTGCQGMYFLTDPEKEKDVKAEFSRFGDKKVAVVVWADQATMDMYAQVRHQVDKSVTYHMQKNIPQAKFIEPEDVRKLQENDSGDWENTQVRHLCDRLKCDMLVRIDLLEFTTRAAETKELRKGRIRASVHVYDGARPDCEAPVYQTEITSSYPPASLHGVPDMDETEVLHETVELFAQTVAKKFYDHGESLRGQKE